MNTLFNAGLSVRINHLWGLLLWVFLSGLVGCGDAGSPAMVTVDKQPEPGAAEKPAVPKPKIALVMKTLTNPFFLEVEKGARRAESALAVELVVKTAAQETSIEQQMLIIDDLIKARVNAIVITPGDSQRLIPVLKKATAAGIKLVNIDNRLDPEALRLAGMAGIAFVGVDNEKAAHAAASWIARGVRPGTQAAIIEGIRSAHNANERMLGAKRAFAENKAVRLVASETAHWKIDEGYQVAKQLFARHPDLTLLFAANDMMALGALKYLQESRRSTVKVAGYDALAEAVAEVKAGRLAVTVDQQAAEQGFQGVMLATRLIKGDTVPEVTLIETRLVTADQFKKMKWPINITGKLVAYLLLAGIVPLLVYGVSGFFVARNIVIGQASAYHQRIASDAAAYFALYRSQVEDLAASVVGNEAVIDALFEVDRQAAGSYALLNARAQIGYLLNNFVRVKGLVSIDLFSLKGKHFHVGETLHVSEVDISTVSQMLRESEAVQGTALWRGIDDNINKASSQKKVITLTRLIHHFSAPTGANQTIGLLVVNLSNEVLHGYFESQAAPLGNRLMATDRHGRLMYHDNPALVGLPMAKALLDLASDTTPTHQLNLDGEAVIVTTRALTNLDGYLFFVAPLALQTGPVNQLALSGLVLLLVCLVGIAGLARYYAKTVVIPLRAVSDGFRQLRAQPHAAHQVLPVPEQQDEIASLIAGFNAHIEALAVKQVADARLKGLEQSALENAQILRAAIDAIDASFTVLDNTDKLVFYNEQFRQLIGATDQSEVLTLTFEEILRSGAKRGTYPEALGRVDEWVAGRMALHQLDHSDWEIKLNDGRWLHIIERKTPAGQIIGLATDVTSLKQMHEAALAASYAKSTFLANMSHEIRTPINAILGMAHLLQLEGVSPRQKAYFDKIDTAAQHLLGIINNILDLSKIEAGKLELEEVPVMPGSLLANVGAMMSDRARAKGIRVVMEATYVPQRLVGDAMRLQQALLNYASNAIKFTQKGMVTLRAEVQAETINAVEVRFEVQDTGIGIAPEAMSRLFGAFEQADNSMTRKYGGTGLGLRITQRLAELMGGAAGASSTPGLGSVFWFTAKLKKSASDANDEEAPADLADVDARTLVQQRYGESRILVVDDDPVNRKVVQRLLKSVDLVVDTAVDWQEALELTRQHLYRVIFLSLQMPAVEAADAVQQIRQIEGYLQTPVIGMTTEVLAQDPVNTGTAAMSDCLTKPVDSTALFEVLLSALTELESPQRSAL